jgi:hypothetical protein
MELITIVFCYRDREFSRIKRSMDSLEQQESKNFKVIFIDYGSEFGLAYQIENLVKQYKFAEYFYNDTRYMPWNRSHALNCGIRLAVTDYIFTADVDMIFRNDFITICNKLIHPDKAYFFSVYYLPEDTNLNKIVIKSSVEKSKKDALGLGLIPTKVLVEIGGYDEFYCFWGKEDNDIEQRLKVYGLETLFYTENVLLYHMHHKPVHNQHLSVPKGWLIFQDNYFLYSFNKVKRNLGWEWGRFFHKDERVCVKKISSPQTEYMDVVGRNDFLRYVLNKSIIATKAGEVFSVFFRDSVSVEFEQSSLNNFAKKLNKLFGYLKIPFAVNTVYQSNFEDIYDSRDVVAHFVAGNRNQIEDFSYLINGKELKIVVRKKLI